MKRFMNSVPSGGVPSQTPTSASPRGRRSPARSRRRPALWLLTAALVLAAVAASWFLGQRPVAQPVTAPDPPPGPSLGPTGSSAEPAGLRRARELLSTPRSGGSWHSGIWAGGDVATGERVERFGKWRGTAVDAITMYPATATWETIKGSDWHIQTFASSPATLSYGLPLLPQAPGSDLAGVAAGSHDDVFRTIASLLVRYERPRTIVRVGWEANGSWFPWNATAETANTYKQAFRRVVQVMRGVAPDLIFDFDIGCGVSLRGQTHKLDALTLLYPGDDVVDIIGCDTYDWHHTKSHDEQSWQLTQRPTDAPGIADVAEFARARGKGLSFPEWGLASPAESGVGDNPFFIRKMREFMEANADVMVLESYFSEPSTSLANSIWSPDQNPRSSETYARLW